MILGLSDKILKIYGFCNVCGMEATKTYRKEEGGGRTQVGAANIYEPRCLKALDSPLVYLFSLLFTSSSTTLGSAKVVVSPKLIMFICSNFS
jgi:hypothetical protein